MLRKYERRGCPIDNCTRYEPNYLAEKLERVYAGEEKLSGEQAELVRLYEEGLNDYEIAGVMGRPRVTITDWRKKMGLPSLRDQMKEGEGDA